MKSFILLFLSLPFVLFSQTIDIQFDSYTIFDDAGIHLEIFSDSPTEDLMLPELPDKNYKFLELFYSWKTKNDELISVLVIPQEDRDILYVDKNNDENLTNDGDPILFPHSQNEVILEIKAEEDPLQIVRLSLTRRPDVPDSSMHRFVLDNGDLNPELALIYGTTKGTLDYKGEKGTYYFDDRVTLSRGKAEIGGEKYLIGLFDYSNNGSFKDEDDLLIVDLDGNGKLQYHEQEEVFSIHDIISIGGDNYEIANVDKYGKSLSLIKTDNKPTAYFLKSRQMESDKNNEAGVLDADFWNVEITTLDNKMVKMSELKGKYIFINFWGEWCKPCIKEIPELTAAYEKYQPEVVFIGLIKNYNLEKAVEIIEEYGITWQNAVLTPELEEKFKVKSYPTNLLIKKDGTNYILTGPINRTFFDLHVE